MEDELPKITFEELERLVHESFEVKDTGIVRLVCAIMIANKLEGDPVWLFMIAPPSGLKTELIRVFDDMEYIYPLSSLTPHTLISGQKTTGKETSLLLQMAKKDEDGSGYWGIFTFKDFTSVLEMNKIARDEILSQLREVYDGEYTKSFGTGATVKWSGKVGFLAGVTEAVDLYQGMYNILGERFVQYRMAQPNRKDATRKGMENAGRINSIRKQMKEAFTGYINSIGLPEVAPDLPSDWLNELVELSDFATLARSGVMRDPMSRDITNVFSPEMPIRFAKQLATLARTFLIMGTKDQDRMILRKIAFSSLPKNRLKAFHYLSKQRGEIKLAGKNIVSGDRDKEEGVAAETIDGEAEWTSKSIAVAMGLPTGTARRILQEINAQGFICRGKSGASDTWALQDEYKEFFRKYYKDDLFDMV